MTGTEETMSQSQERHNPDLTGLQRSNGIQFAKCWGGRQENNLVTEIGENVALIVIAL